MRITWMRALARLVGALALAAEGRLPCREPLRPPQGSGTSSTPAGANGGWLRIVGAAGDCRSREQAVSWNVAGPAGEPGPAGPPGPKGDPGAGLTQARRPLRDRVHYRRRAGGEVELDFAGDDTVLFRCVAGECLRLHRLRHRRRRASS